MSLITLELEAGFRVVRHMSDERTGFERIKYHVEQRMGRAKEHNSLARVLAAEERPAGLYFAICDLNWTGEPFDCGWMQLRPVPYPPELHRFLEAQTELRLSDTPIFPYLNAIRHELVVFGPEDQPELLKSIGCAFLALLRVRTRSRLFSPAIGNHPWSIVPIVGQEQWRITAWETASRYHDFEPEVAVSDGDCRWAATHMENAFRVKEDDRYDLAETALLMHHHENSLRMAIASLWAGIEAIVGVNQELTFRLSATIATLLEERGEARFKRYEKIKTLYGVRSKAVHGSQLSDEKMRAHILEARQLLSELLCNLIERGQVPDEKELTKLLFL